MGIHQQMLVFSLPLPICGYLLSREGVFPSLQKHFDNLPFRKSIEELTFDQSFSPALVRGGAYLSSQTLLPLQTLFPGTLCDASGKQDGVLSLLF